MPEVRRVGDAYAELLAQFTTKCGVGGLASGHLATGKFPMLAHRLAACSIRDQYATVCIAQDTRDDMDACSLVA